MLESTIRIGRKGVVVLPKSVRTAVGLREGSIATVSVEDGEVRIRPLNPRRVRLGGAVSGIVRQVKEEELGLER